MLSIHSHPAALAAQHRLARAQAARHAPAERLASGQRVNSAADDAAGSGIASRITAQLRGTGALERGLVDAISLVQVAQAALSQVGSRLQRALELAVQAANAPLGVEDRAALTREWSAVLAEVDRIATRTEMFGIRPLLGAPIADADTPHITDLFPVSGTTLPSLPSGIRPIAYIPANAQSVRIDIDSFGADDDIQVFTPNGRHLIGTPIGDRTWIRNGILSAADMPSKLFLPGTGFRSSASYDGSVLMDGRIAYAVPPGDGTAVGRTGSYGGMNFVYSGDGDWGAPVVNDGSVAAGRTRERLTIDRTTEALLVVVTGTGVFSATANWFEMPGKDAAAVDYQTPPFDIPVTVPTGGGSPGTVALTETPADTITFGLQADAIATAPSARAALSTVRSAIDQVSGYMARYGGLEARFDATIGALGIERDALQGAQRRIVDVDQAAEAAALVRALMLEGASQAMLAQANANPRAALELLTLTLER